MSVWNFKVEKHKASATIGGSMSLLLLQSCSDSKQETQRQLPALELYSGYFYKIIKKAIREGEKRPDLDIQILSAKYGLIQPTDKIEYYDRRMDEPRAEELRDEVVTELKRLITEEGYERVVVNMGENYRAAIRDFDSDFEISIDYIEGEGIGYKGQILKQFIRGDDSALEGSC